MEKDNFTPRFNLSPASTTLNSKRKKGLRISYLASSLQGFFLNSLDTGCNSQILTELLANNLNFKDNSSTIQSFEFLINEGDRSSYNIFLPFLVASKTAESFEINLRKRFLGIEQFINYGNNLYHFLKYIESTNTLSISTKDLHKGILGWDMGQLVCLVRAAQDKRLINKKKAWEYIELASEKCNITFQCSNETYISFVIGYAMKTNKKEDWKQLLECYKSIQELDETE